jgi:hypothetical protein
MFKICPNCQAEWKQCDISSDLCDVCKIFVSMNRSDCWKQVGKHFWIQWSKDYCVILNDEVRMVTIAYLDYNLPFNITEEKLKLLLLLV